MSNYTSDDINLLVIKIVNLFQNEIPSEILTKPEGTEMMYNTTLNLLRRMAAVCEISKEEVIEHIKLVFNDTPTKVEQKETLN